MLDAQAFQRLLPKAALWVEEQEFIVLRDGVSLSLSQVTDAVDMGVQNPGRVRLLKVNVIEPPRDPELKAAGQAVGLFTGVTGGLTLRFGILIQAGCWTNRELIAHELVHVGQYERLGGIRPFLDAYVEECSKFHYPNGPLEQEATVRSGQLVRRRG